MRVVLLPPEGLTETRVRRISQGRPMEVRRLEVWVRGLSHLRVSFAGRRVELRIEEPRVERSEAD